MAVSRRLKAAAAWADWRGKVGGGGMFSLSGLELDWGAAEAAAAAAAAAATAAALDSIDGLSLAPDPEEARLLSLSSGVVEW